MKKVLILGCDGFTGTHFQQYIKKAELYHSYHFVGVDRCLRTKASFMKKYKANISNKKVLEEIILAERPTHIINFVASFNHDHEDCLFESNTLLSSSIANILIKNNLQVDCLLLIGSCAEYGKTTRLPVTETAPAAPVNMYGLTKLFQTLSAQYYFRNHGIPIIVARTFNIIGRGMSEILSVGSFVSQLRKIKSRGKIFVGNLEAERDFLDIRDVITAYWILLVKGKPGEIYNIASGKSISMRTLLESLIKISQKDIHTVTQQSRLKKMDLSRIYGSNQKIKKIGWRQEISFAQALRSAYHQTAKRKGH